MNFNKRLKATSSNGALMNPVEEGALATQNDVNGESSSQTVAPKQVTTFLRKSISSLVMFSYLSLNFTQAYSMDRSKVAPFDELAGIELRGSIGAPVKQKSYRNDAVVPIDPDSPVSVVGMVEKDIESGLGIKSSERAVSIEGSILDDLQSASGLTQEGKGNQIKLTQALFGSNESEVHPLQIGQTGADIEKGPINASADKAAEIEEDNQSVHSVDEEDKPEAIAKRNSILKDFDAHVKDVFRKDMSYLDWALVIAPLVLTGVIAQNEIYGEYRLIIDGVINTFALNPKWYADLYLDYSKLKGQNLFQSVMLYNAYASLPPYLCDRMSSFFSYINQSFRDKSLKTKIGWGMTALGTLGVVAAAVNAGSYPAITLYSADSGSDSTASYAKTLPPYLFAFYAIDSFLINSLFRDRIYKYLFVDRKDDVSTKIIRQSLLKKLRTIKAVIASMSNEELFNLDHIMAEKIEPSTDDYPSIEALKELVKIGEEDHNQHRRYSVKTRNKQAEKHFNVRSFLKRNWPYVLGLGLATGGAYLAFSGSQDKFENLMHAKISWKASVPHFDFNELGIESAQQLSLSAYHAWLDATNGIDVYNGNTTDWCWQCLQSADFSSGSITSGGSFIFTNCPGVSYVGTITSNPGDLGYTNDQCWGLFDYFNAGFAYAAGITTDDYYAAPPLNPLTLTPSQERIAIAAAVLYASVNAILAAPSTNDVIKRISDSFSSEPDEILPGKKHKVWNGFTLMVSGVEAFVRTAFAAVASWYVLQSTDIAQEWLWTIVGLTWISTALNYFIPLDNAYSKIPVAIGKGVQLTQKVVSYTLDSISKNAYVEFIKGALSNVYHQTARVIPSMTAQENIQESIRSEETGESYSWHRVMSGIKKQSGEFKQNMSAAIMCDDYLARINRLINTCENAQEEVVHVINQELIA